MSEPPPSPLRVAVAGANGRMGRAVIAAIQESRDCTLSGALVSPRCQTARKKAPADWNAAARCTSDVSRALSGADALIDFTAPESSVTLAETTASLRLPHVIGTTGFSPGQEERIAEAARDIPIVKSGNMSLGIALLGQLVRTAAGALPGFDIEIVEMHHRMKRDAPSGTALLLGRAASEGRHQTLRQRGPGRAETEDVNEIGFASVRAGTIVGEHSVIFAGPHERIVLSHTAEDRSIFANGALAAARWARGKTPGLYSMADVLTI